jgi:AraC-like DNA-binding protein
MPDANVTEVAFKVGCASPQHLSTLFKKLTGLSPTEWRERVRDGSG